MKEPVTLSRSSRKLAGGGVLALVALCGVAGTWQALGFETRSNGSVLARPLLPQAVSSGTSRRRVPALDLFKAQPLWLLSSGILLRSSRDAAEHLRTEREEAEAHRPDSRSGESATREGGALLTPDLPWQVEYSYAMAPVMIGFSHRLMLKKTWSSDDVELAREMGRTLQVLPGFPILDFREQDTRWNLGQIGRFLDWFEDGIKQPAILARMLYSLDDGPFAGLSVEGELRAPEVGRVPLTEDLELVLLRDADPTEPMVLQMRSKGQALWTRRVSGMPIGTVTDVTIPQVLPRKFDPHGWKIRLYARWSFGMERMDLFVGPDGGFLFYYLSW